MSIVNSDKSADTPITKNHINICENITKNVMPLNIVNCSKKCIKKDFIFTSKKLTSGSLNNKLNREVETNLSFKKMKMCVVDNI